jgi:hypothetical protein
MDTSGATSSLTLDYIFEDGDDFPRLGPEQAAELLFRAGEQLAEKKTLGHIIRDTTHSKHDSYELRFSDFVKKSESKDMQTRMENVRTMSLVSGRGTSMKPGRQCAQHPWYSQTLTGGFYIGIDKNQEACWFWGEWIHCVDERPTMWIELDRTTMTSVFKQPALDGDHASFAISHLGRYYDEEVRLREWRLEPIKESAQYLHQLHNRSFQVSREID